MKKKKRKVYRSRILHGHIVGGHSLLQDRTFMSIIAGILMGVGVSTLFLIETIPMVQFSLPQSLLSEDYLGIRHESSDTVNTEIKMREPLYIGVLSAGKFLSTRATACNRTWGQSVSKLEFFSATGDWNTYHLPIVNLPGVDDNVYPPQLKAFRMLEYICQNHINDYNWFVRADDDVYIKVDELLHFLQGIDHSKKVYIGQPGYGLPEVRHQLGLNGCNFCMGGPGVVFSRMALLGLCPHINDCLSDVVSKEDDVEIGRCVTKHLGIQCTRSWQFLDMFYHAYKTDYDGEKPFTGNLLENPHVVKSLTLHHAKEPAIMYHIHRYYISEQVNRSVQEISELSDSLNAMHVLVNNLKDDTGTDHDWVSFSSHYIYRPPNTDKHSGQVTIHIQKIVKKALHYLQNEQGINLTLSHFIGGYYSVHFKHIEYLIDFKFTNHQPDALSSSLVKCVHLIETLKYPQNERIISDVNRNLHVNFVIVGEHNSLTQFLESFETMELKWQTSIVNILFVDASPQATSLEATSSEKNLNLIIAKFKNKHTNLNFQSLEQNVNQLNGYLAGFQYLNVANRDTLFLFGHTNIHHIVWSHCLTNTIKGKQIYLPVPWYDKQEVHLVDEQHMQSMFTFCAYGSDVSKANIFTDKYSQQLNAHQVIEQFTKQQIFVFQAYEPVFFSTPIR